MTITTITMKMTAIATRIDDNDTAKACSLDQMLDDYIRLCRWHGKCMIPLLYIIWWTMKDCLLHQWLDLDSFIIIQYYNKILLCFIHFLLLSCAFESMWHPSDSNNIQSTMMMMMILRRNLVVGYSIYLSCVLLIHLVLTGRWELRIGENKKQNEKVKHDIGTIL